MPRSKESLQRIVKILKNTKGIKMTTDQVDKEMTLVYERLHGDMRSKGYTLPDDEHKVAALIAKSLKWR